jgi:RimJ/RimL family protein N-acetyltransferase
MNLTFRDIQSSDRGLLKDLLVQSYQPLKDLNEHPWIPGDDLWQDYDDHVFDNLGHEAEHVFLTEMDGGIVGFASFRISLDVATIGRNSVLPIHRGKGIGSSQVHEIIRRCLELKVQTINVQTGVHRFFEPAQKMYLRAGFEEVGRDDDGHNVRRVLIRYRFDLEKREGMAK